MKPITAGTIVGHLALFATSLIWSGYGWFAVKQGRIIKSFKHSHDFIIIDGPAAMAMATLFIVLGAISALIVLRRFGISKLACAVAVPMSVGLPALFL